jgi:hypothetical protein
MSEDNPLNKLDVEVDSSLPIIVPEIKKEDIVPEMTDPDWSDYVFKHFEEDEMIDGNPTVDGLRRVTKKLIGDIVESVCNVVQAPLPNNDFSATVEHAVRIVHRETGREIYFREVADVNIANCDAEFRRFATSTASTRAEARALRKALMLKRVVAAEEITTVAPDTPDNVGKITKNQINFLVQLCKRNNINLMKYINLGTNKFDKIEDVPYSISVKMIGVLNEYQQKPEKIKDSIKGWDENWNKK